MRRRSAALFTALASLAWGAACIRTPPSTDAPASEATEAAPPACLPIFPVFDPGAPRRTIGVRADAASTALAALTEPQVLILSWLDQGAADAFAKSGAVPAASIVGMVARAEAFVVEPQALRGDTLLRCELFHDDPAGDSLAAASVPIAILDLAHNFWPTVLGAPTNLVGVGEAATGEASARVLLHERSAPPPAAQAPRSHCEGPRLRHLELAREGEPTLHLCARTPADLSAADRRYPAVYLLPGLGGDDLTRLADDQFLAGVDALDAAGRPAIYVGVDTRGPAGSMYVRAGDHDLLGDRILAAIARIDAELPTDPTPAGRLLLGQSTGGWNAVAFALAHPGVVGGVGASSPDALDLESWLLAAPSTIRPAWLAWMRLEAAVGGMGQMLSYAAAWSPPAVDGLRLPAHLDTGAIDQDVLAAWLAESPLRRVAAPAGAAALTALGGRLLIGVADNDEFGLAPPAQRFAAALDQAKIEHTLSLDHRGHFAANERFLEFLDRLLPPAPPPAPAPAPAPVSKPPPKPKRAAKPGK